MQENNKIKDKLPKVYLATEENKKRFNDPVFSFPSLDGKYLVVYTEESLAYINECYEWTWEEEEFNKAFGSVEGRYYYSRVDETRGKNRFNPDKFGHFLKKINDENIVLTVAFESKIIKIEQDFVINKADNLKEGIPASPAEASLSNGTGYLFLRELEENSHE